MTSAGQTTSQTPQPVHFSISLCSIIPQRIAILDDLQRNKRLYAKQFGGTDLLIGFSAMT